MRKNLKKRQWNSQIIIGLFLCLPILLQAQYERPGSALGQFLKIGVSPRASAMGNAFIAASSGADGTYYNPAVLSRLQGFNVMMTHTEWFADINHDFAAAAYNFGRVGAFGISMTGFSTDLMKVRTPLQPEGTGETFFVSNYRVGVTYARNLTDRVSFGGTVNYVRMSLHSDFQEPAYSADISALYITGYRDFQFAMKIANFGSSVAFVNEEYPLPLNFTFGMAINALEQQNQTVLVSSEVMKPNDGQTLVKGGLEWEYNQLLFLRGGYQFNHDIATFAFGGGLRIEISDYTSQFDYALSQYGDLGTAHRFGVCLNF